MLHISSYLHPQIVTAGFPKLSFFFVFSKTKRSEADREFLFPLSTKDKSVEDVCQRTYQLGGLKPFGRDAGGRATSISPK